MDCVQVHVMEAEEFSYYLPQVLVCSEGAVQCLQYSA